MDLRGATRGPKIGFSRSITTLAENGWGGWPGAPRTRGARWGGLETVFVRFTAIRARAPIFGSFERFGRAVSPLFELADHWDLPRLGRDLLPPSTDPGSQKYFLFIGFFIGYRHSRHGDVAFLNLYEDLARRARAEVSFGIVCVMLPCLPIGIFIGCPPNCQTIYTFLTI